MHRFHGLKPPVCLYLEAFEERKPVKRTAAFSMKILNRPMVAALEAAN
jgi:hypothetical protein